MKKWLGWAFLAFAVASPGSAQEKQEAGTPQSLALAFFQKLQSGAPETALEELLKNSPLLEQPQQLEVLKGQLRTLVPIAGKVLGFEFLDEEKKGSALLRVRYVVKYEKDGLIWSIMFYRPKEQWVVSAFKFLPSMSCL